MTSTTLRLRYSALSDVGRVRKDNQDSGYAGEHLLVIADGVGGAARGDLSSSTAVQILRRLDAPASEDMLQSLAGAIHRAHDRIAELVEEDPELEGTSTTVTAVLFDGTRIGVGHVGDSRGYLLRDGTLTQLTKDHTFVQSLVDEGRITEQESRTHPHRNLILRAVDGVHETDPDLSIVDLAPGDRLLLCSDGCSGVLDGDRLAQILGTGTVDYAAVELVRAALEAGSTDNVTCIVADAVPLGAEDDEETSAASSTGPMLVGAAAEQPRRAGSGSKSFFRAHRAARDADDTDELEPVRGVEEDVDPEELRYAPRPPRRFPWLGRASIALAVVLVLALACLLAYRWTQTQYFVAADGPYVAIYKGVQAELPGIRLSSVEEDTKVTLASLPAYGAESVRSGIAADNAADAHAIVARLTGIARVCPTPTATPLPSAAPAKPSGSAKAATRKATASKTPSKASPSRSTAPSPTGSTAAASPSPAPSPTLAPPNCLRATP